MQNIPLFTTEYGVATLVLKEIPSTATAYILIRDTQTPEEFVAECKSFCRAAGADHIYGTGHDYLEKFPFHTAIWGMSRLREGLPDTDTSLFPVTEDTLEIWRKQYNDKMIYVPNAAYMTIADGKQMLKRGDGYFIHRGKELLGIGMAAGETVDAVISLKRGAGHDCMLALNHALSGERITLQVASTNTRAVALYERMGFSKTDVISNWYKIM